MSLLEALEQPAKPAVLAGILDLNTKNLYQYIQGGRIPPPPASYKTCILEYVNYLQNRAKRKAGNLSETQTLQEIKKLEAVTEKEWLNVKVLREGLINMGDLAEEFEPIFLQIRMQLTTLARTYPETQKQIDTVLESWSNMGQRMMTKSEEDLEKIIAGNLIKEIVGE